ncbi:MAG: efflux RND transporter periplasmic adaptor subunit [Deltaproteobacteria bacterium]|nr:MAG: efflux RND transporter periplasmic adaptor subunit [Deltaproteobacteria bacterium]
MVLPVAIILGGVAIAALLFSMRPHAEQAEVEEVATPVEVVIAEPRTVPARVEGTGTVVADAQVVITPQVGGRIVEVAPELRPGGIVARGQVLARIDPRDYQLAVTQAESQVAQARLNLALEQQRAEVARREWELVGGGEPADEASLALRGPQLAAAEQALAAAEATLASAKLSLERSVLRAPFDAVVLQEGVDVGQMVGQATQVATLVGTERLRVEVQVPVEELPLLEIPGLGADVGSPARVVQNLAGGGAGPRTVARDGAVVGLGGQIDPATRTATVLVAVEDPLGDGADLPLLPGAFVEVEMSGRPQPGVTVVPDAAVHDGTVVWVVADGDRLVRREVTVGWRQDGQLYLTGGLEAGDRVVTSPLSLPVAGMAVRVIDPETSGPGADGATDRAEARP